MTKKYSLINLVGLIFLILSQQSVAQANINQPIVFIYVHGLGGKNQNTQFVHNLKEFFADNNLTNITVKHYSWDSPTISFRVVAPAQFLAGKKQAKKEAKQFSKQVFQEYEQKKITYYIIGHSFGTYLIIKALENYAQPSRLKRLGGIFFLGSTLPKNYTIKKNILPEGLKIQNYYSEYLDGAVSFVYSMEGVKAAGSVGFDDTQHFKNFQTTFTHSHKGFLIHRDYSILAQTIGYIALLKENIFLEGKPDFEIKTKKLFGKKITNWFRFVVSWDNVYEFTKIIEVKYYTIRIQQRWPKLTYRIVVENNKGQLYQLAKGDSLHAMLQGLGLF